MRPTTNVDIDMSLENQQGILNSIQPLESVVLVPVNFKEEETSAIASSIFYAQSAGLPLIVYHTCVDRNNREQANQNQQDWIRSAEEKMEKCIRLFAIQLMVSEVPYYTHVDTEGVKQGIERLSLRYNIDLIVTNGQEESRWFSRSLNRFSSSVIGFKDIPGLVIPVGAEMTEPKRVVLALNSNERYVHNQFKHLRKFVKTYNVEVQVIEVIKGSMVRKWNGTDLKNWLEGISYELQTIYGEDVAKSISDYAEQVSANLVCVISFADYPLRALIDPSVSRKIASETKVPLLVLK
jgi:hypothetical protein